MVGDGEGSACQHVTCACGHVNGRPVEMLKHLPGFPLAQEANDSGIHLRVKECHGTTHTQGVGADILWIDAHWVRANGMTASPKGCSKSSS